ncbi:MAG: hypothetical protein VZR27_09135 [Acutalibacteraceae bacterium]|nr:hypothetical protein [Acutalibacteraceae bacterium]
MKCINLCDILDKSDLQGEIAEKLLQTPCIADAGRLYIGSYFCSQYFLKMDFLSEIKKLIDKKHIFLTLVIPIISEKDLEKSKEQIRHILEELPIDEVTVNDVGMLSALFAIPQIRINLGRLFFKDARDIRLPAYYHCTLRPSLLNQLSDYRSRYGVQYAELDPICSVMDLRNETDVKLAIHGPFGYLTTGNICKYASISKDIKCKFRPNISCNKECQRVYETYTKTLPDYELYRIGRAVYFASVIPETINGGFERSIYAPFHEMVKLRKEGSL